MAHVHVLRLHISSLYAMSSAAARAEARRKAILARGGDRLAKLTSSARGEDASAYLHDGTYTSLARWRRCASCVRVPADPPLAPLPTNRPTLESFVGEETNAPRPTSTSTAAAPRPAQAPQAGAPSRAGTQLPPAQEEQMRAFREALAAAAGPSFPSFPQPGSGEDPFAALMASMAQPGGMPSMPQPKVAVTNPKTRLQKLLPFIHLIAAWILLMYFILRREPEAFESRTHNAPSENLWRRWAELAWESPGDGWGVQPVVSKPTYVNTCSP